MRVAEKTGIKYERRQAFIEIVAGQLRQRRLDLKVTQREVSEAIGVTEDLVTKWENGFRYPSGFLLFCWIEVLGLKMEIYASGKEKPG